MYTKGTQTFSFKTTTRERAGLCGTRNEVNEFHQITAVRKLPRDSRDRQSGTIGGGTHKGKAVPADRQSLLLGMRSVPLPDSILVSADPGSGLTPGWVPAGLDIYFRDPLFLSCNASFSVFPPDTKQSCVGTEVQWPNVQCFPKGKTSQIKTVTPWRFGI